MQRSKNNTDGNKLPYSSVIVGAVVKALDLDHGILKERTARRFFRGERVSEKKREEIFGAFGETIVDLGIVPEPAVLKRYGTPMSLIIGEALDETSNRWDALLALMQSHSASIQDHAIAINGFLRLVVVDFALRLFALARLADLDPPTSITPLWAERDSQRKLLRGLAKDSGLTREQLADRLERSGTPISDTSIDNWLDGNARPTREHVAALAEALAHNLPNTSARQIENQIQRELTLSNLADLLTPLIGNENVAELGAALYRFVRIISENVDDLERPPLEENPTAEVVALAYGTAHRSTFPLLKDLASVETDPSWKNYIMVAAVSWEVAFQRIATEAGMPRLAAGLAQDISDVSPVAQQHQRNPRDPRTPDPAEEIRQRMMQEVSIDDLPRIMREGLRAMWRKNVALRRGLVRDFPTDPEAHFNLGSYLGMLGKWTRRRDLIEDGINECKIAWALLPEWDAPAVEPAIILGNYGAYEESLQELSWAQSVLPAPTPHLQYCFGYTLMMLERYDEALPYFDEVLKAKPNYALALRDAALCSFKLGDHSDGISYAKKAREFGDPVEYNLWRDGEYSSRGPRVKDR